MTQVNPVYRFRSTAALLDGFHELENQEIYFAPPQALNDPMEGYKDLFWSGDAIVWKNLIRHYVLCLQQAILLAPGSEEDQTVGASRAPVEMVAEDLHPAVRKIFDSTCDRIFSDQELELLPKLLEGRTARIRRNELLTLLWLIHYRLLKLVCTSLQPEGPFHPLDAFFRHREDRPLRLKESFGALNAMDLKHPDRPDFVELFTEQHRSVLEQTNFIRDYNGMAEKDGPLWRVITSSFPEVYVNSLEDLLYSDWYTACFVTDPTQAAMWGVYADGHKGVCLKFGTTILPSGKSALALNRLMARGVAAGKETFKYAYLPQALHPVQYQTRLPEIDFYRSLGKLTARQLAFWFRSPEGTPSATGADLLEGSESWRQQYWKDFQQAVTTKLIDWSHEGEQRITLQSGLTDFSQIESRKLRYRFDDLQGIIFGIKTTAQDKVAIARTVLEKCKQSGRTDFEFHQAYYSRRTGKIETTQWTLVKPAG